MFDTVLGQSMMRMYKEAVEEEENNAINVEVEEGWKSLLRKDGDAKRYRDALLKDECAYLVEGVISDFGKQHGVCKQALAGHVSCFLHERLYGGGGLDPYYSTEDEESEDNEDGEDENDDDNEEEDSSDAEGMTVDEAGMDEE